MAVTVQGSAAAVQQQEASTCPTCGEMITGQFCPSCGEQKYNRHSFSFRHFAHHAGHELFHLDSKILSTVRYLFSRPAFVTAEYLAGKRSRYVNPLRLYLLSFAVAMLLTSTYHPTLDFKTIANADRTGKLNAKLEKFAKYKGISEEALLEQLKERLHFYYEGSKILNALVMTCLLEPFTVAESGISASVPHRSLFLIITSLLSIVRWPFWLALGSPVREPLHMRYR